LHPQLSLSWFWWRWVVATISGLLHVLLFFLHYSFCDRPPLVHYDWFQIQQNALTFNSRPQQEAKLDRSLMVFLSPHNCSHVYWVVLNWGYKQGKKENLYFVWYWNCKKGETFWEIFLRNIFFGNLLALKVSLTQLWPNQTTFNEPYIHPSRQQKNLLYKILKLSPN